MTTPPSPGSTPTCWPGPPNGPGPCGTTAPCSTFFTDAADRATYRDLLQRSVAPGGLIIVGTFAADGPEWCSGLPVARYDPDHLASELGDHLQLVAATRTEHHTPSGATQPFTWVALRT